MRIILYHWSNQPNLKIIDPKLIVTLGKHSMERFFPTRKISQIHGKALRKNISEIGVKVFYALYHPAAALYNGSMRSILISDFKKIPKILEAIENAVSGLKYDVTSSNISKNGNYYSLNLTLTVPNEVVRDLIYQKLDSSDSIKIVF